MASDPSSTSPATPLFSVIPPDPPSSTSALKGGQSLDLLPSKTLKRSRQEISKSPTSLAAIVNANLSTSPSPKSPRYTGSFSPVPLTGAAALEDERRRREDQNKSTASATSDNPSHKILSALISSGGMGMSKPSDAPAATTSMSGAMGTVANSILIPASKNANESSETSPASVTSLASLGNASAQTATASQSSGTAPGIAEADSTEARLDVSADSLQVADDKPSYRAFTFPGNVLGATGTSRVGSRGMSLPMSGLNQQIVPRSPSHKKHKCPYCDTEFTRHHNLKSHLLTHSQEKPYSCPNCQMRFRRLHDLKRHTKLHTGERPHICPKCDRKFARGDALARHSKGQGGCAGRGASMGSFGGDEDLDGERGEGDESMEGVIYAEPGEHHEGDASDDDHRRFSLPSIKAQHVGPAHRTQENYSAHNRAPSTYPPIGPRHRQPSSGGGLFPPGADHGGSTSSAGTALSMQSSTGHSPNTSISTAQNASGLSIFSQVGMTESPKPLSPGGVTAQQLGPDSGLSRQRSPSLTTQFQQQHFGRHASERSSPQGMSLPSPYAAKLPALSGLAPPEPRFTLPSQGVSQQQAATNGSQSTQPSHNSYSSSGSGNPMFQPPMMGPGRSVAPHPPSGPQEYHQSSGSGDSGNNLFATGDRAMWTYIQQQQEEMKLLSERVGMMENVNKAQEDKINRLTSELDFLRSRVGPAQTHGTQGFNHMQQ